MLLILKYYFDEISNNIPYRNRALTTASINILNMIHSSNKYLITDDDEVESVRVGGIGSTNKEA